MLLSVLLISSAVLGAATIAGLLVLFQIRQTADAEASAQAVFAADAGMEKALYEKYRNGLICGGALLYPELPGDAFSVENREIDYIVSLENDAGGNCIAKSAGRSGRSTRAFILFFAGIDQFPGQYNP